ncbi:MAG: vitamin K epoxide reductase family protein, partial [Parafilimonas sp.]
EVFYLDETNKIKSKKLSAFLKEFKEVVLLAQANENSGEANFEQVKKIESRKNLRIPVIIFTGIFLILAAIASALINKFQFAATLSLVLLLNFCGLLVAAILLWYEVDKANPALQKICTGGKKTNCSAILNSKAAKILGLSWSELGFFYFSGCFLTCLLSAFTGNAVLLSFIQIACLAAVLYVPFSIFYQWKIAKQWCPLCLTVQAILFLEFVLFLPTINSQLLTAFAFQLTNLSTLLLAFSIPVIVWLIIKPLLYYKQKGKEGFRSLQRIKFNTDIFNALLKKQKYLTVSPEGLGIMLGNKNAANTLIKVCNPYCPPCAKAHPEIEKLLEANKNLKVQIIFRATNDENDITALPVKHLLAIAENNNEVKTKHALDDWYMAEKKDYNLFAEKYKLNGELKMQNKKIDMMKNWYDKAEIKFTPTIFFNGYQLPDAYSIGDLKYFLTE